jgi:undecaprenyl pyrophosphate phosphatase UppP
MTYLQALVIALTQGVTEMFPISSLGHSVLVPAWIGGSWQAMVTQSSQASSGSSFYLAYIVALHCASALALMWFFRADWIRIIRGFLRSLPASVRLTLNERRLRLDVADKDERLAWMIIFATIPVGLTGLALEHPLRTLFATPAAAAVFLFINGLILLAAEAMRRSAVRRQAGAPAAAGRPAQAVTSPSAPRTAAGTQWQAAGPGYPGGPGYGYPSDPRNPGYPANPGYGNPGYPGYREDSGYPRYRENPGYPGYRENPGYPGYREDSGYPGYRENPGYRGYPGDPGYPGGAGRPTLPLPAGGMGQPASHRKPASGRATADIDSDERSDARIARLSYANAILIGAMQILALMAGISRSGVTIAGGLWRGLDHEDAARFAFLLATPVILAAGVLKVPSLLGPAGAHIHGQVILGVIVCGIASYLSVRLLVRWFQTRTLTPFIIYCLAFGALSIARFI